MSIGETRPVLSATSEPVVSIGMPIFNAGPYLRKAVVSIINQSFSSWELIIIDDASTDGAVDSIRDLDDARIRIIRGDENRGLATRLNEAVASARGKYFARMDQDDLSHPDRLSRQVEFLGSHPRIDVVGSRCLLIDGDSRTEGVLEFPIEHDEICGKPWRNILMPHPTWMGRIEWFRRHAYRSPGPYFCEDQELLLRTHRSSRFHVIPEPLLAYRVRGPIPLLKLCKTRITLASIQFRHFVKLGDALGAAKALAIPTGKCVGDLVSSTCSRRGSRAAYAGVPLVAIAAGCPTDWLQALKASDEAREDGAPAIPAGPKPSDLTKAKGGLDDGGDLIRPGLFWLVAFVFCCLQALMVQKLVLPLVPSLHAGHGLLVNDAILFHETAAGIAERIRSVGWSEWSLYPPGFSGNVGVLSALYAVFGPEPSVFIPLNAAAHVTGALMIYLIGPLLWPGRVGRLGGLIAAVLFVGFPSTLLWYSQNHKDAFAISGALILLYAWLLLLGGTPQRNSYKLARPLISVAAGLALVLVMRPYLSMLLAAAFVCSWVAWWVSGFFAAGDNGVPRGRPAAVTLFLALVCGGAALAARLPASETALKQDFISWRQSVKASAGTSQDKSYSWAWRSLMSEPSADRAADTFWSRLVYLEAPLKRISELRAHFIAYGKYVGAGSGLDEHIVPDNALDAVVYLPRALVVGVLAPFPNSWIHRVSLPRLAAAGETFAWYLLAGGLLVLVARSPSRVLVAGLAFCAVLIAVFSYTNPNIGTLYRVRFGYWMFILLCGSVGWIGLLLPFLDKVAKRDEGIGAPSPLGRPSSSAGRGLDAIAAAGSAALVITFVGFLGFLARDLLLINLRGMGADLDAFFAAAMLPMVFVSCLGMPLADAFTKPFLSGIQRVDVGEAGLVARRFLGLGLAVVSPAVLMLVIAAGPAVALVLGAQDARSISQGASYLRLFAPILLLSAWTVVGNSVLNSLQKSSQAAASQLVVPVCAIASIILSPREYALLAGALGMLCGTLANALLVGWLCGRHRVVLWPLRKCALPSRPEAASYIWLVFAAVFTALVVPVNFYFAAKAGTGSVSAWAFAGKIVVLFNSLFAFGVTAVVLPHLATKFEKTDNAAGRSHLYFLLVVGTWAGGLIAAGLSIFAEPLVYALFSAGGQVSDQQMITLAKVLRIGALQVPVAIAGAIVTKSAAVSGAANRAVWASLCGLIANLAANILLVPRFGLEGIAVGALLAVMVSTLLLCFGLRAGFGLSLAVGAVMLYGWLAWIWAACSVEMGTAWAFTVSAAALGSLAILHWIFWKSRLYHRSSLRRQDVLSR